MKRRALVAVACAVVVVACSSSGPSVATYDACSVGDSCAAGTICQSASADSTSGVTFCTHSCESSSDCPADEDGVQGVCTDALGSPASSVALCYRSCETTPCPSGSACVILFGAAGRIQACQPSGHRAA